MPPKTLSQLASESFALEVLQPILEDLISQDEERIAQAKKNLANFFTYPYEICRKVLLSFTNECLRAQCFILLTQENFYLPADSRNDLRRALSNSLRIPENLILDTLEHRQEFNRRIETLFFHSKIFVRENQNEYHDPFFIISSYFNRNDFAVDDIAGFGLIYTLQERYEKLNDEAKAQEVLLTYLHQFPIAAARGELKILRWIFDNLVLDDKKKIFAEDNYQAFRYASKYGHLKTVQYIYENLNLEDKESALRCEKYEALRAAACYGHRELAQWLYHKLKPPAQVDALKISDFSLLGGALIGGHLQLSLWIYEMLEPENKKLALKSQNYHFFKTAVYRGHLITAQWIYDQYDEHEKETVMKHFLFAALRQSSRTETAEIAQWIDPKLCESAKQEVLAMTPKLRL